MNNSVMCISRNKKMQLLITECIAKMPDSFTLVCQLYNSIDALDIAVNLAPQIILIEDDMPFLGGIQFINSMHSKLRNTQYILILTTDSTALSVAPPHPYISGFLPEKNATAAQLEKVLQKAAAELDRLLSEHNTPLSPKPLYQSFANLPWLRQSQVFAEMISNLEFMEQRYFSQEILPASDAIGWLIIATPVPEQNGAFSFFSGLDILEEMYIKLNQLLNSYNGGNVFIFQERKLCIWFKIQPELSEDNTPVSLAQFFHEVNRIMYSLDLIPLAFQRSENIIKFEDLPGEYRRLDALCKYRFFLAPDIILYHGWLKVHSVKLSYDTLQNKIKQLSEILHYQDIAAFNEILSTIFLTVENSFSFHTYSYVWNQLIFFYNFQVDEYGLSKEAFMPTLNRENYSHISFALEDLRELFATLMTAISSANAANHNRYVERSVQYISKHISERITLTQAAAEVHVSAAYLCRLFQQELGKTFTVCMNELKIAAAKKYLLQDYGVEETAQKTGFDNPKYFSRVFKSYTGISPREYQKNYFSERAGI